MKSVFFKRAAIVMMAAVTMSFSAVAQKQGDMAAGGNLILGLGDNYTNVGIGGKFFFNITDPIRLAGEFDIFPKQDYVSMWDISGYGHYLFPVADKVTIFPSVGLGVIGATAHVESLKATATDFVLSLGGGVDFELTSNLVLNGELRIKIKDGTRLNLVAGIAYKF